MDLFIVFIVLLVIILTISLPIASSTLIKRMSAGKTVLYCNRVVCSAGYQLSFCKHNYTNDYCIRCPVGSIQNETVDSAEVKIPTEIHKCVSTEPSCPPEAVPVPGKRTRPTCKCDTTRGYAGDNYHICIRCEECPPGMELKIDGQCRQCPPGTFNPSQGYGPCRRLTKCKDENREVLLPGNRTVDAVCGRVHTTTSTKSTLSMSEISTQEQRHLTAAQSNDVLDGFLFTGDEIDPIYSNHEMEMRDQYESQQRLMFATMAIQILFLVAILLIIIIGFLKIRNLSRDLLTRRVNDIAKDEECLLGASPSDDTDRYESEPECVSLYQPVTIGTVYPVINSRPCTPTAPQPSIVDFQNKC